MEKELGKIESVRFGVSGDNVTELGVFFTLSGIGWGVKDKKCGFDFLWKKKYDKLEQNEKDCSEVYSNTILNISRLLRDAKVSFLDDLQGKPIEATFNDNGTLKEWRILTEVL